MVGRLWPRDTVPEAQYVPRTFIHPKTGAPTQMNTSAIVEGMGLSWSTQVQKLRGEMPRFNCFRMKTVARNGKEYSMLAIPVRKLNLWLTTVNANKIKDPDKRRAVLTLLNDPEWSAWADREIARQCGVSPEFVRKIKPPICQPLTDKTVQRGGSTYTMNTAAIGRTQRPRPKRPKTKEKLAVG